MDFILLIVSGLTITVTLLRIKRIGKINRGDKITLGIAGLLIVAVAIDLVSFTTSSTNP